ncbi:MAG TPA: family 20 glycosylhydrolase, partial [Bacteroidota bacterium]|nr:family 20 glycosylhydrolase [Bacteroidota bacterium]
MLNAACITIFPLLLTIAHAHTTTKEAASRPSLIVFHIDFNSVALKEDYLRKWLRNASAMGYNAVLWEIEGKVKWETCPECASPDAFSKSTFRDILAYSRSLGLEAIPLLQTVGHAEYVLQHEKYSNFKEDPEKYDCYATCNPELRRFIRRWIQEYLELFGAVRYFHLGGDEAYEFATSPGCSKLVAEKGKGGLFAEYLSDIAQPLLKKGIRPCIWNDQIMKYPEAISQIPKSFVFWDWNYWDGDSVPPSVMIWDRGRRLSREELTSSDLERYPEILDRHGNLRPFYTADALKRLGYDVVLCSSSRSSGDGVFAVRQMYHASNIFGAARKAAREHLLGNCVTSWAIRIPSYE